ncbi:hypothetical protein PAMP_022315 [Pampus punctatissimus]
MHLPLFLLTQTLIMKSSHHSEPIDFIMHAHTHAQLNIIPLFIALHSLCFPIGVSILKSSFKPQPVFLLLCIKSQPGDICVGAADFSAIIINIVIACRKLKPTVNNENSFARVIMLCVFMIRFAVAFTDKLKEEAELFLLSQDSKIYVQPQGIQTEVAEKFCWTEFLRSSGVSREHVDQLHVFLLVCGLRRVKDPLYLVDVFSEWHNENPQNVLVIIGPKMDPAVTVEVEAVVKRTAGVFLAQERSQQELHAAMKRCFAVVNCSVSEGMSAAILEVNIFNAHGPWTLGYLWWPGTFQEMQL